MMASAGDCALRVSTSIASFDRFGHSRQSDLEGIRRGGPLPKKTFRRSGWLFIAFRGWLHLIDPSMLPSSSYLERLYAGVLGKIIG
jgi:hypothetical protein